MSVLVHFIKGLKFSGAGGESEEDLISNPRLSRRMDQIRAKTIFSLYTSLQLYRLKHLEASHHPIVKFCKVSGRCATTLLFVALGQPTKLLLAYCTVVAPTPRVRILRTVLPAQCGSASSSFLFAQPHLLVPLPSFGYQTRQFQMPSSCQRGSYAKFICLNCRRRTIKCRLPENVGAGIGEQNDSRHIVLPKMYHTILGRPSKRPRMSMHTNRNAGKHEAPWDSGRDPDNISDDGSGAVGEYLLSSHIRRPLSSGSCGRAMTSGQGHRNSVADNLLDRQLIDRLDQLLVWHRLHFPEIPRLPSLHDKLLASNEIGPENLSEILLLTLLCALALDVRGPHMSSRTDDLELVLANFLAAADGLKIQGVPYLPPARQVVCGILAICKDIMEGNAARMPMGQHCSGLENGVHWAKQLLLWKCSWPAPLTDLTTSSQKTSASTGTCGCNGTKSGRSYNHRWSAR
ncbi:uncharacterized protein MYCFIDRAFT_177236 [Pseudocercospora fijiensis CIRAD86]|uniref:Uncharacterized protein n=1 Tax=Pseudocercospora fijiensis (strain CIRAD86) TaxID=383855 RepID=M3A6P5_PSEFD|nr:uncharacterized protein MYCFIDRAFT_177236 [Pseudocercospora fijiensis CIRAD86]EME80271.1 hypothetical protein MYCFIDRAFT_177236 [Pseudocercospora fijiensis CIRAD86]